MAWLCQRDSYLRSFKAVVTECQPTGNEGVFKVKLDECLFFPGGGGQINGLKIDRITTEKSEPVIYINTKLSVGEIADCEIDWERRYDHTQQHSGKSSQYCSPTFDFCCDGNEFGSKISNIEIDCKDLAAIEEKIPIIEQTVNEHVRNAVPVTVHYYTRSEAMEMMALVRPHKSNRIQGYLMNSPGVDYNLCCGTHVKNLCELQMVILLHRVKIRGNIRQYFMAGNRVYSYIRASLTRQGSISTLLGGYLSSKDSAQPEDHEISATMKELVVVDSQKILKSLEHQNIVLHNRETSSDIYLNSLSRAVSDQIKTFEDKMIFLTVGGVKGAARFCVLGEESSLRAISSSFLNDMDAKGSVNKRCFQGKLNKVEKIPIFIANMSRNNESSSR
ncbi:Alanyl-tRNA editing protein Aarsd1 [Thelohanellus kitauei]|uniref:Alanyl-tRNA editing protein Aarsd1 n=1 Tax=Thelohanellus kitauei TaxID=669202 RepID=A0A0C2NEG4_THEKT|nr:Alanyl-tRNA editing protein Aarsd1 [Thelohanellus kitauei]